MSNTLQPASRVLWATRSFGPRQSMPFLLWVLGAFGTALFVYWNNTLDIAQLKLGMCLLGLVAVGAVHTWFDVRYMGVLQINHPVWVRMVPGHLRAQRVALITAWAWASVVQALIVVATVHVWRGIALDARECVMVTVTGAAALLALPVLMRWGGLRVSLAVLGSAGLVWVLNTGAGETPFDLRGLLRDWREWSVAVAALVVPSLAALAGWGLLRSGTEEHRNFHNGVAELWAIQSQQLEKRGELARRSATMGRMVAWLQHPFHAYMAWLLARRPEGAAAKMARIDMAFGADAHWTSQTLWVISGVMAYFVVTFGVTSALADVTPANRVFQLGLFAAIAGVLSLQVANAPSHMLASRREQAVMLLVPGTPRAAALNQALARRQLMGGLRNWALLVAMTHASPWFDSLGHARGVLAWLSLPLIPLAVRDLSKLSQFVEPQISSRVGLFQALWLGGLAGLPFALTVGLRDSQLPQWWFASGSVALFLLVLVWRFKRLSGYAEALPAGRFA